MNFKVKTLGALYFCFILLIGFFNILNLSILNLGSIVKYQNVILIQGWGFFTKNPRDIKTSAYYHNSNIITPLTCKSNIFGISRHSSRYIFEIGLLIKFMQNNSWKKTLNSSFNGDFYTVKTEVKNPLIKGKIIIVNEERTPWAWAKFEGDLNYYKSYLKLNVI